MLALAGGGLPLWQDTRLGLRKKDDQNRSDPLAADQEPAKHGLWHEHAEGLREFVPHAEHYAGKTFTTQIQSLNCLLRLFLARLHRKTFGYSKPKSMLEVSLKLLIHKLNNP